MLTECFQQLGNSWQLVTLAVGTAVCRAHLVMPLFHSPFHPQGEVWKLLISFGHLEKQSFQEVMVIEGDGVN